MCLPAINDTNFIFSKKKLHTNVINKPNIQHAGSVYCFFLSYYCRIVKKREREREREWGAAYFTFRCARQTRETNCGDVPLYNH